MKNRLDGTYVLRSNQITLDGKPCDAFKMPQVGQTFVWQGEPIRLDGPNSILLLDNVVANTDVRRRAARVARRRFDLTIAAEAPEISDGGLVSAYDDNSTVIISDGLNLLHLVPIDAQTGSETIYLCANGLPALGAGYKVVSVPGEVEIKRHSNDYGGDVICFTTGTNIRTENGTTPVEQLNVGDLVQTKDAGLQEILWIGHRRMSGARMHAMPDLRPVRLRRDALGGEIPDDDLLVSPHHRILMSGDRAMALFNQPEVLVAASDLINDKTVFVDHAVREVTYVHLLFRSHQIIWANGIASESYHPANTTLQTVDASQRGSLLEIFPDIKTDPHSFGPFARRNLDRSEAAILTSGD
jgi:hypothetical protein